MRTRCALHAVTVFTLALSAISLDPIPSRAATASTSQEILHEVAPGDGLRLIAGYYYGDTRQWKRIWDANRNSVRNPNLLERGSSLRIPDAVTPTEPYADFVARTRRPVPALAAPPAEVPRSTTEGQDVVPPTQGAPAERGSGPASPGPTKAR